MTIIKQLLKGYFTVHEAQALTGLSRVSLYRQKLPNKKIESRVYFEEVPLVVRNWLHLSTKVRQYYLDNKIVEKTETIK